MTFSLNPLCRPRRVSLLSSDFPGWGLYTPPSLPPQVSGSPSAGTALFFPRNFSVFYDHFGPLIHCFGPPPSCGLFLRHGCQRYCSHKYTVSSFGASPPPFSRWLPHLEVNRTLNSPSPTQFFLAWQLAFFGNYGGPFFLRPDTLLLVGLFPNLPLYVLSFPVFHSPPLT